MGILLWTICCGRYVNIFVDVVGIFVDVMLRTFLRTLCYRHFLRTSRWYICGLRTFLRAFVVDVIADIVGDVIAGI